MYLAMSKILVVVLFSCFFILINCAENKTDKRFEYYFLPRLNQIGIKEFTGNIISFSNDACQKCTYYVINNKCELDSNTIITYDTTVYNNLRPSKSCSVSMLMSDDLLARINYKGINGHRIYWINNNKVIKVKELNAMNVDSLYLFLQ